MDDLDGLWLFDGVCNFCSGSVQVALRLDPECLSARFAQAVLASGSIGGNAQAQRLIADALANLSFKDNSALAKLLTKTSRH